jgi:hypothetical protein
VVHESQTVAQEAVVANIGRKVMWAVAGGVASKVARNMTRKAMTREGGAPRLPRTLQRRKGMEMALVMAMAGGALMAMQDVLSEQGKAAARAKPRAQLA